MDIGKISARLHCRYTETCDSTRTAFYHCIGKRSRHFFASANGLYRCSRHWHGHLALAVRCPLQNDIGKGVGFFVPSPRTTVQHQGAGGYTSNKSPPSPKCLTQSYQVPRNPPSSSPPHPISRLRGSFVKKSPVYFHHLLPLFGRAG